MYGTIEYFSDCLTASVMNRLVNEQADTLNDCYTQLQQELAEAELTQEVSATYERNLEKAYQLVRDHFTVEVEA